MTGKDWTGSKGSLFRINTCSSHCDHERETNNKRTPPNFIDLTGETIGNFKVIKRIENNRFGKAQWLCQCLSCGKEVKLLSNILKSEKRKSCGCLTSNLIIKKNLKHGLRKTRIYNIWAKMKARCYNKNEKTYKYYGERGIEVCLEWNINFKNFYDWSMKNGYENTLTLDRINVNGNYEPSNCRWVSMKIQCNNKRNHRIITYKGETKNLSQWCEDLGLNMKTVHRRIVYDGWSIERAFETSVKGGERSEK